MDARYGPEGVVVDLQIGAGDRPSVVETEHELAAYSPLGNVARIELALVPQLAAAIGKPLRRFAQDRVREQRLVGFRVSDRAGRQNLSSPS